MKANVRFHGSRRRAEERILAAGGRRRRTPSRASSRTERDLATWAAVISATVAAIALIFTGLVAFWDIETARDQLTQSQKDAERKKREQASMVTIWPETDSNGQMYGVVANRSRDPVSGVDLFLRWRDESGEYHFHLGTIPPCTRMNIKSQAAHLTTEALYDKDLTRRVAHQNLIILRMSFTDSTASIWSRDSLHLREMPVKKGEVDSFSKNWEEHLLRVAKSRHLFDPKVIENCGREA